jgi:hypothetical protein
VAALSIVLAGCSGLASTAEDPQPPGPGATLVAANHLKASYKNFASFSNYQISEFRPVHTVKGLNWITCIRFQDSSRTRTYALFFKGNAVVESHYALRSDSCDTQAYMQLDIATGTTSPLPPDLPPAPTMAPAVAPSSWSAPATTPAAPSPPPPAAAPPAASSLDPLH